MEKFFEIYSGAMIAVFIIIIAVAVVLFMFLVVDQIIQKKRIKSKLKPKLITVVLYDRLINNIVKTMVVPGFIQVIKLQNKNRHDLQDGKMVLSEYEPEFKMYHFFCIRDDGKHVFIERS